MALYPPLLEAYQPAFSYKANSIRLYFKPPNTINMSNVGHLCIKMTYQSNNRIVPLKNSQVDGLYYYFPVNGWVNENNSDMYYVDIAPQKEWEKDTYYKIQMRFGVSKVIDSEYLPWRQKQIESRGFSEWSTVMVLKAIEIPKVEIINQKRSLAMYLLNISASYTELTLTPQFYGSYSLNEIDSNEPLDKYRFQLYKITEEGEVLIEDSSWQQFYSNNQDNIAISSVNTWRFKTSLEEGTSMEPIYYQVIYSIKTVNYYEASSEPYLFKVDTSSLGIIDELQLSAVPNPEEGSIDLYLADISWRENPTGNYIITRTDERSNFQNWQDLHYFTKSGVEDEKGKKIIYTDYTVESGLKYKYMVWTVNSKGIRSKRAEMGTSTNLIILSGMNEENIKLIPKDNIGLTSNQIYTAYYTNGRWMYKTEGSPYLIYLSDDDFAALTGISAKPDITLNEPLVFKTTNEEKQEYVWVDFEHSYLYCNGVQLKLEYNLKLSSFKRTVLTNKQDTLGSKYPTIMRNGYTDYAEFPLSGLISIHMDDSRSFLKAKYSNPNDEKAENYLGLYYKDDLVVPPDRYCPIESRRKTSSSKTAANKLSIPFGITADTVFIERMFREKVIEFLNDGGYKLYKSPTEGNFIISLINTSLTPNATLGRMLFDFSATAYEVAENTLDNMITFGLIDVGEYNSKILQESEVFFGQVRLEDLYEVSNENWVEDKGLITGYNPNNPPNINFVGNVISSIMNIEETNTNDEYRYNVDTIYSLEVEPYPMVKLQEWIDSLVLPDVPSYDNQSNDPLVKEFYYQDTNIKRKAILRKKAIYEHFKENWVYNKPIYLTINDQEILVGSTPKKYVFRGELTKADLVNINIPALVNYTCGKSIVEDTRYVVSSSFQGEDWGQIVVDKTDKEEINIYEKVIERVQAMIKNAIESDGTTKVEFNTLVSEGVDSDGVHDFWRTDESKKWRYQFNDFVYLKFEGLPGTKIQLKNKNGDPGSSIEVYIGPTGVYNLHDFGNTDFDVKGITIVEPKEQVLVDYRVVVSIKEMSDA